MMFAIEFLNFVYDVQEFSSKTAVFTDNPYSVVKPEKGFTVGFSSGIIPGDIYGGGIFNSGKVAIEFVGYRSGDILITQLPDTTKEPSANNPPEVVDRVNFASGKLSLRMDMFYRGPFKAGLKSNVIYSRLGSYGWGAGGGFDVFSSFDLKRTLGYLEIKNVLTSPVIWSTGYKEFALPMADLRFGIYISENLLLSSGILYSPDGRGIKFARDGYISLAMITRYASLYGGFVEGFPRMGFKVKYRNYTLGVGTSYHADFGFSFRGDVSIKL